MTGWRPWLGPRGGIGATLVGRTRWAVEAGDARLRRGLGVAVAALHGWCSAALARRHRQPVLAVAAGLLVMGIATAVLLLRSPLIPQELPATTIRAGSTQALEARFEQVDFEWPPADGTVPRLAVRALPHDLDSVDMDTRKSVFFRAVLPLIVLTNERIREERTLVQRALENGDLPPEGSRQRKALETLAARYRVEGHLAEPGTQQRLLRRADVIPAPLALAQAANESGWGRSRFVRRGNSLFGEWTFREDAGLVPTRRGADKQHAVRHFPDLRASVRSYVHNLNVGHAYAPLRALRAEMRQAGGPLDAVALAAGLESYSIRGPEYVAEIQAMIRQNDLHRLSDVTLR